MITTKGAARFHSNGFAAPAAIQNSSTMTTTPQAVGPTAPNPNHSLKRLASCREELERSWQQGGNGAAAATTHELHHCVSSDGGVSDDAFETQTRTKRRRTGIRTFHTQVSADDHDMMTTECTASQARVVRGIRISPDNRPRQATPTPRKLQVKAGWYEGEVDALGNRHGMGTTKHDDGTEYQGPYSNDVMEGPDGTYKFVATRHLVPNPRHNGSHLHRQIEKTFMGFFKSDMPNEAGMIVTKTMDCVPQVLGSMPLNVPFMEVVYDMGMHSSELEGKAVGEGVRVIYSTTNVDGRSSSLEMTCFRLSGGENANMKVAPGYAAWMVQCMGMEFPEPPKSL